MLRDADIVEAWESGHVAGIPASLRLRCGKVTFGSAVKCLVATSKVSRKVYLTPLFSLGLLLITASSCAYSQSGKPEACADQKGSFDGTLPLRYAVVRGVTDNRLYFHPEHPSKCASPDVGKCKGTSYVRTGDTVGIGNNCGTWDYIQYIGQNDITEGWVDSRMLLPLSAATGKVAVGYKSGAEPLQDASVTTKDKTSYSFRLTKGQGKPVCEAYLQRLNRTQFIDPPFCGIPEDHSVPGFFQLRRKYLTHQEMRELFSYAYLFEGTGAYLQGHPRQDNGMLDRVYRDKNWVIPAWRYEPRIDIDNDGIADDVLIWQGLTLSGGSWGACGEPEPNNPVDQQAFVLNSKGNHIDEPKTRAIFWRPPQFVAGKKFLSPITLTTDIFRYRQYYYFDGFYDAYLGGYGDFEGNRKSRQGPQTTRESGLGDTLAVFLRKNDETLSICELQMNTTKSVSPQNTQDYTR
jgi:hypothetical protein